MCLWCAPSCPMPHLSSLLYPGSTIWYFVFLIPLLFKKYITYARIPQQQCFILFVFEFCKSGVKQLLSSRVWFVYSVLCFQDSRMLLHVVSSLIFMQDHCALCKHTITELFIPFIIASCFPLRLFCLVGWLFVIMNITAKRILIYISYSTCAKVSLKHAPGSWGICICSIFHQDANFYFPQRVFSNW